MTFNLLIVTDSNRKKNGIINLEFCSIHFGHNINLSKCYLTPEESAIDFSLLWSY